SSSSRPRTASRIRATGESRSWCADEPIDASPIRQKKVTTSMSVRLLLLLVSAALLGGCATATRPVNPPIAQTDPRTGYRFETRQAVSQASKDNLVILAFSGG